MTIGLLPCLAIGLSLAVLLFGAPIAHAQVPPVPDVPEPAAEDVASVDAIVAALYDVISGPAGPRDWDRMRSLMLPTARLIPTGTTADGQAWASVFSIDEYIERAGDQFMQNGFFEKEVARKEERYGNVVHAFSTYESFRSLDDEAPFMRGINSIQVIRMADRWWIANITWQGEQPDLPVPDAYLK